MNHHIFGTHSTYDVAILIKSSSFRKDELIKAYVEPFQLLGVQAENLVAFDLSYKANGKAPVSHIKEYLKGLLKALDSLNTTVLYCCDAAYFKVLTGEKKADPHHGYIKDCTIPGFERFKVVLGVNHSSLFVNPDNKKKLDIGLNTIVSFANGTYKVPGQNIIHSSHYPQSVAAVRAALQQLHQYDELTCDIEAFSLDFWEAGIGTIAFAWDQHNGMAFPVDYRANRFGSNISGTEGTIMYNPEYRELLREFFESYKGKITYHNAGYDIKVMIYELYMEDLLDQVGLLKGLHIMTKSIDDTQIISYLAVNSCAGNKLSLKEQAHEFAGNYAEDDIKNILRIPIKKLLKYNLVDCLSTWYVKNKHYPTMVADDQLGVYQDIMIPSIKSLLQIELTGMPMDMDQVLKAEKRMTLVQRRYTDVLFSCPTIKRYWIALRKKESMLCHEKWKAKTAPIEHFNYVEFNPGSPLQLQHLLYDVMDLPVIDTTDTKQPATGNKTLAKLLNHTDNSEYRQILRSLIGLGKVDKILAAFIPAFKGAVLKSDGMHYLHGSFRLGGTVSGRLSCARPNLQQIPSGSTYASLIKKCFKGAPGWIFSGADFASLEDRISALTTQDPNKLKVYTDGYDGHCLRAFGYFGDEMPDIEDTVESINSIAKKYKKLRQKSKAPTFALTYQGTWHTLVNNLGISPQEAQDIEKNYHIMYSESDTWVEKRLHQASRDGFITCAFGLRVRTPLLSKVILGLGNTPYEAAAEGRTAGNALGQSWGLLTNRACNEFMERVWASEYALDIKPVAMIHDAIYLVIKDKLGIIKWVNDNLAECMAWQDDDEIRHDTVKLFGELDLFHPDWNNAITLPNHADKQDIVDLCK
ncbi:MAG: DNA polymerase I [Pseudoalteromonas sp.]|nr:DNA polymerase I [Pseudoalteromonas sp.]